MGWSGHVFLGVRQLAAAFLGPVKRLGEGKRKQACALQGLASLAGVMVFAANVLWE